MIVAACVPAPQSRPEFVGAVTKGQGPTVHENFVTPFALNMVEATLKQKGAACLDKTVEKWGAGAAPGTRTKSTSTYVPTVERNTAGVVELTVRVRHNPRGIGSPPDGVFLLAADLRAQESKTEVDLYAMTFAYDHIADAVRGWLRGEDTPCPELD